MRRRDGIRSSYQRPYKGSMRARSGGLGRSRARLAPGSSSDNPIHVRRRRNALQLIALVIKPMSNADFIFRTEKRIADNERGELDRARDRVRRGGIPGAHSPRTNDRVPYPMGKFRHPTSMFTVALDPRSSGFVQIWLERDARDNAL